MICTASSSCVTPEADGAGCILLFNCGEDELKSLVEAHEYPIEFGLFMRNLFFKGISKISFEQEEQNEI